jgi:hypothetical protein
MLLRPEFPLICKWQISTHYTNKQRLDAGYTTATD